MLLGHSTITLVEFRSPSPSEELAKVTPSCRALPSSARRPVTSVTSRQIHATDRTGLIRGYNDHRLPASVSPHLADDSAPTSHFNGGYACGTIPADPHWCVLSLLPQTDTVRLLQLCEAYQQGWLECLGGPRDPCSRQNGRKPDSFRRVPSPKRLCDRYSSQRGPIVRTT
jgi:hypothetical protein